MNDKIQLLRQGFESSFVNINTNSNLAYRPQFISNNYKEGQKVLSSIENELLSCHEFYISVAFITKSGITPLLQTLKELERRQIPGKILTTDYLYFTDPEALKMLEKLQNCEIRIFSTERSHEGFHTKGYIFKSDEIYRIIVGSSNMTLSALTKNKEWNTRIISTDQGEYTQNIMDAFERLWQSENTFTYDQYIEAYTEAYQRNQIIQKQKRIAMEDEVPSLDRYRLQPNSMQLAFIQNLRMICASQKDKALLISATGTGKTYASAFAMRELGFNRVLFLVHRNQIAKQAKKSFQNVFSHKKSMGFLTGETHDYDSDYIFSTVQTLSKDHTLAHFAPDTFDAIIIDEAHHSVAGSYQKIMNYFTPQLWLGMTATPDKRDDHLEGRNIYETYDHQIACEIRLQDAMEEDLLCPFHYFGITDLDLEDPIESSSTTDLEKFRYLTPDERVTHIMKQAHYFSYSGDRVKGLIFCSRIDEAKALSEAFNQKGWRTLALSGSDSEAVRSDAIERLAGDEKEEALDYILSVDIFSEGVDVPEINQVIMLRPTESPIVFIQQLGRGLRKAEGKEYVVILDFIGNYQNNFMIPIALSGDRSYNKDNIRRYVSEGSRIIPGASTVHFDEISRKRIFQSIDHANFSLLSLIKENYQRLKDKLGHIPSLMDFDCHGEMDVLRIFDNPSLGSYHQFLSKHEKDYHIQLSDEEIEIVEFISKKLVSGKRIHELELLRLLFHNHHHLIQKLKKSLYVNYQCTLTQNHIDNIVNIMTNQFLSTASRKSTTHCIFLEPEEDDYKISENYLKLLNHPEFSDMIYELIEFGCHRWEQNYQNTYKETDLVLYQKYTYEDVCRLLCWEKNEVPLNIGGYKYDQKTQTFPVFINYDKDETISDTTRYEDHFLSSNLLIAISKSGRSLDSEDVQNFLKAKERGISVELFVRKNKDDKISKEFYYLGRMTATGKAKEFQMPNTTKTAVEIEWLLDTPVREDIYDYIVNS